jgi:transcriptional regulator with XRE-family HTH domain
MSTTLLITKQWASATKPHVTRIFKARPSNSKTAVQFVSQKTMAKNSDESPLKCKPKWRDREYREGYMEASVEQGIAWQIRINRTLRHMTQANLAQKIGSKPNGISRLEDPEYGAHSLETLKQIAKAFDCALLVKFISYGELANESEHLSETDQFAVSYELETEEKHG